jgi:hypothetical protein
VSNLPGISIRPTQDNGPAEIYFSRLKDGSGDQAGDNWIVGTDAYGAGDGVFTIATGWLQVVMRIAPSGQTTFNYPVNFAAPANEVTVGSRQIGVRPWVAGCFQGRSSNGPCTVVSTDGHQIYGASRSALGVYDITWLGAHPKGSSYMVLANMPTITGFLSWSRTPTSLTLICSTNGGFAQDPPELDFQIA